LTLYDKKADQSEARNIPRPQTTGSKRPDFRRNSHRTNRKKKTRGRSIVEKQELEELSTEELREKRDKIQEKIAKQLGAEA